MGEALEARGLTLSWEDQVVVEGLSLTVPAGGLACLVGRSGCGKTTVFHALAGLTEPDAGQVLLGGRDVTGRPGQVAYMLQKDLLLDQRTIVDNVALPLLVRGMKKAEAREKAAAEFARFGLAGCEGLYPCQLSGGMRQRAALLRTHLMDCQAVLMDEPFSALDALTRNDLRDWLRGMIDELGLTCMVVTHDVDEAVALADDIYVLAGDPAAGRPSRLVGEVPVPAPRADRAEFALSDEALAIKRDVLRLLA